MLYYLIVINILLDILAYAADPGGVTAVLRAGILFVALFYASTQGKINLKHNFPIVFFVLYVLFQLFFADDFKYSFKVTLQVITSISMYFLGFAIISSEEDFKKYISQYIWVYLLIVLNTVVSNILGLGFDHYTLSQDYVVGGLNDLWNNYTYSLIMFPLVIIYNSHRKYFVYILAFLTLILLLLSLKRIAILGVVFAALIYLYYVGVSLIIFKRLVFFLIVILLSFPLYGDLLTKRFEKRAEAGRFEADFYESEGRYMEILVLQRKYERFENPIEIFFGLKAFDSRGGLGHGRRQFHVDYTLMLLSIGIFGLVLYFLIYFKLIELSYRFYRAYKKNRYLFNKYNSHVIISFVLILTSLVTSFAGQMYHVSFRLMIFMSLGAIHKLLYLIMIENNSKKLKMKSNTAN